MESILSQLDALRLDNHPMAMACRHSHAHGGAPRTDRLKITAVSDPVPPPTRWLDDETHGELVISAPAYPTTSSLVTSGKSLFQEFATTQSRVVRFFNLPSDPLFFLSALFSAKSNTVTCPLGMWLSADGSVFGMFETHAEACAALRLSGNTFSVSTFLERDLAMLPGLKPVQLPPFYYSPDVLTSSATHLPTSTMHPNVHLDTMATLSADMHVPYGLVASTAYPISSNPPNPKNSFRAGDWICPIPSCSVHNFSRNVLCRGCQRERPALNDLRAGLNGVPVIQPPRLPTSPRFAGPASAFSPAPSLHASALGLRHTSTPATASPLSARQPLPARAPAPVYPLLTPSGRSIASGGSVRNVSTDPTLECIMYWPDNEPLPIPGQLRPREALLSQHPPILNTGNRGPIEHQPGDWICKKCNYLNWRRRKVCQTCFPYAEGNGDSISTAVQAERLSLLTNVLNTTPINAAPMARLSGGHSPRPPMRSMTMPHPSVQPPHQMAPTPIHAVTRSRSQFDLAARYAHMSPIYQTSGNAQSTPVSPIALDSPFANRTKFPTPPLPSNAHLPSFLHDIMQSPSVSPTSTASVDLFPEDAERYSSPIIAPQRRFYGTVGANGSSSSLGSVGNIWGMDVEEKKALKGGVVKMGSRDRLNQFAA